MRKIFGLLALVSGILAAFFFMDVPKWIKYKNGDVKVFSEVAANELSDGDLVKGEIDETWGQFAEREETNTTFGIKTSSHVTKRYYAIYNNNNDRCYAFSTGNAADYELLDRLTNEVNAMYDSLDVYEESKDPADLVSTSTVIPFEGTVATVPADLNNIFADWYGEGFASDCEGVMIVRSDFSKLQWALPAGIGCAVLAVVFLVLMFVFMKKASNSQKYGY